ncbi:MAG: hypothetical protein KBE65_06420 [Phycisphaerae bacterium]|nr:hypothetical protein [Phycisphaerae bacterium]
MEHRKSPYIWAAMGLLGLLGLSRVGLGATTQDPSLQDRIEQLEKQVADLKKEAATPASDAKPAAPKELPAKKSLWSNLDIQLYGYVKGDASRDSSRTSTGNFVLYVDSEATKKNDAEFNLTANQTRLGLNISGPESETMKASGKIEIDFFGNYADENKAKLQMRHAYLTLLWPKSDFSLLAGQTWDVVSPLSPNTLNYSVMWDAGNTGYRRPQFRLTKSLALNEKTSLKFEAAVARTIGRTDAANSETGEDAGLPTAQGRVSVAFPLLGPKPTVIGLGGHSGREEYDLDATGRNTDFDTWMVCLDATIPVCKKLTLLGELFSGENLNAYYGGINQGVNTGSLKEIRSKGGWIAASLGPWSQWAFNLGAGVDDVNADDVAAGARTLNSSIFANVLYSWTRNAQAGFELSRWNTHYSGDGDADDIRAQLSFIYSF